MAEFFAITLIIILAAISPGPDFAMVVKNALQCTRQSAIFTALGVSCSLIIHSIYAILGLAVIISQSLLLFTLIKYIGAAYLIYIGTKSLLSKQTLAEINENALEKNTGIFQAFLQGLLCNLLNPKAIMFILSFFTLIVKPSTSLVAQLGFGIEIALIHFVWFSTLAFMITHQRIRTNITRIQHYIIKLMGIVLIGFGARIASLNLI